MGILKTRFKVTKRKTPPAILREVKRILEDPKNFAQHNLQEQRIDDHGNITINRVCTLGALNLVATSETGKERAKRLLQVALFKKFGTESIAAVNDGKRTVRGAGQKNRARQAILESIDAALTE